MRGVVALLHQLAKMQGCAILLVTHDHRILDVADRVVTLEDGRLSSSAADPHASPMRLLAALSEMKTEEAVLAHVAGLSEKQFLQAMEQLPAELQQFLPA